jgi:hypothetical protein
LRAYQPSAAAGGGGGGCGRPLRGCLVAGEWKNAPRIDVDRVHHTVRCFGLQRPILPLFRLSGLR